MISLFTTLGFGFLLGLRHATDADHVVAVTTILGKNGKISHSTFVGILWGIGHSITVTLIAIPVIFYSFVVPKQIGLALEFFVGVMLASLGILSLSGVTKNITEHSLPLALHKHKHKSPHGDNHYHFHLHLLNFLNHKIHHIGIYQTIRPIVVGLVHGLAGSAAIALLILSTIKNPKLAALYLFIFHFGVVSGMMIITTALGASILLVKRKNEKIHHYLVTFSGILSFVFGLYIMYQIGFVDSLFH